MGTVYSPFGGIPYPDEDAAYDVPAHLSAIVAAADPQLVGTASSTADRDSKFFSAPAGYICKVVYPHTDPTFPDELIGIYVKTGKAGIVSWKPLYEPSSSLVEQSLQMVDGYQPRDGVYVPTVFQENANFAVLNGAVVKSDASTIATGSTIAYLPAGFTPYRSTADYACPTTWEGGGPGAAKLTIFQSSMSILYTGPTVHWVGFDGIRFRTQ